MIKTTVLLSTNYLKISFQETFSNNEIALFKLNPNPVAERVNKIVSVNEKLKQVKSL